MKEYNFIHLHTHTQYSLLDGAIRLEPLFKRASEYNMPAVAITDHGTLFGAIDFFRMGKKYNIKAIIGCEVYLAPKSRFDKSGAEKGEGNAYHLTLLARNNTGYKNLIKLVTAGFLEGFYYKPRIDKDLLSKHSEGLIALSGCLKGEASMHLSRGNIANAKKSLSEFANIFDKDSFYIEIHDQSLEGQLDINKKLIEIGRELSIPLVAANDCHYLDKKDAKAHDVLVCIQTGKTLNDAKRLKFSSDEFYFKSKEEMFALFKEVPEALSNTVKIADMCSIDMEFNKLHLPKYTTPDEYTLDGYLNKLAYDGLKHKMASVDVSRHEIYLNRLKGELAMIAKMEYSGYFLIVWDFIDYAKRNGIPVGPGRGSAAGSLVAYTLGITTIDPIKYDLIFERFLNPERVTMPDIDIDFCMEKRGEVIDYVTQKYGKDNVTQIITFGSLMAKGVIRDVGRAMDIPYAEVDKIAKLVPNILNITLTEAVDSEKRLSELIKKDEKIAELIETAITLEGLPRHASTHAAGVVISPMPLTEYLPLYKNSNSEDIVTQFPMSDIERLGLLKMDFLGLKTLTVISNTIKLIKEIKGIDIDMEELPMDDEKTYSEILCEGKTMGVFQLESNGMRELLKKFKPRFFEDIIAIIALYRPGPLNSGMVDDYVNRKHGRVPVKYELPQLEEVLKETYGVIVYQEQVMKISSLIANYTSGEADLLRRAMGKKKPEEMAKHKEKFVSGAIANNIPKDKGEKLFDLMAHFAEYGFNKSHSAAYAKISYQTAYLKAHYAYEFMASILTSEISNTDKMILYINECREMGIEILPPDINDSSVNFTVTKEGIRFGLAAVKNVGRAAVDGIIQKRKGRGRFTSLLDFCKDMDSRAVTKKVIENFIKCGAFDGTGGTRAAMMADLDKILEYSDLIRKDIKRGQISLFGDTSGADTSSPEFISSSLKELEERLLLSYEKETLGFYISGHPLISHEAYIKRFANTNTKDIKEGHADIVIIGGIVNSFKVKKTKKGDNMAYVTLEDLYGSIEVILFPDIYQSSASCLEGDEPLIIKGSVDAKDGADVKIIAKEITPLSAIQEGFKGKVHIKLFADGLEKDILFKLRDVLSKNKGDSPVCLHFLSNEQAGKKVTIMADRELKVRPTELMAAQIESVVGENAVYFE